MIKLMIDISEELYAKVPTLINKGNIWIGDVLDAVKNGTPLPKHHGRLKDVDAFISKVKSDRTHSAYLRSWTADDVLDALNNSYAPTIIEADKEAKMKGE